MKLFITGATGFIGSNLIKDLSDEHHEICLHINKTEALNLPRNIQKYKFNTDNQDENILFFKKQRFDGVIHLATSYIKNHCPNDINNLIESNVLFSCQVLECSVQSNVKWFLNTGSVFQNLDNKEFSPLNLYSATKEAFVNLAKYYYDREMIKFCTLKLSDTYGPNDNRTKLINLLINSIETKTEIRLDSHKSQFINLTHIHDVISAYKLLINLLNEDAHKYPNGTVFELKNSNQYTLLEVVEIIEKVSGIKLNLKWNEQNQRDNIIAAPPNSHNVPHWSPKILLDQGIMEILRKD